MFYAQNTNRRKQSPPRPIVVAPATGAAAVSKVTTQASKWKPESAAKLAKMRSETFSTGEAAVLAVTSASSSLADNASATADGVGGHRGQLGGLAPLQGCTPASCLQPDHLDRCAEPWRPTRSLATVR